MSVHKSIANLLPDVLTQIVIPDKFLIAVFRADRRHYRRIDGLYRWRLNRADRCRTYWSYLERVIAKGLVLPIDASAVAVSASPCRQQDQKQ